MTEIPQRNFRPLVARIGAEWTRTIYRSSALVELSSYERATLKCIGKELTYIDLRSVEEAEQEPFDRSLVENYISLPVSWVGWRDACKDTYSFEYMFSAYQAYWYQAGHVIIELLRWLASEGTGNLIVACSAGKDRTGMIAVCLGMLLGRHQLDLIADYCRSFTVGASLLDFPENPFTRSFKSNRDFAAGAFMTRFLQHVENHIGIQSSLEEIRLVASVRNFGLLYYWDNVQGKYVFSV